MNTVNLNWQSPNDQWILVEMCVRNAFTTFIEGAPGLGKTYAGLYSAEENSKIYQITFNPDQAVQELQGTYIPTESGAWVWHDGPILQAFRNGGVLILNEMGRASDAVLDFLIAVTDSKESARITLMNGETISRHPSLRIIATSNSAFSKLPEALQDRFEARLKVTAPNPAIIDELNIQSPGLGSMVARSYSSETKSPAITSREAFAYIRLKKAIGDQNAAYAVWGNTSPEIVQEVALAQELTVK